MKIVLIGAGSAQFGFGTLGDIFSSTVLKGSEVDLVDTNGDALKIVQKTTEAFIEREKLDFSIKATTDRKEVLPGADFVISSIEVGNRFELWDQDWTIPLQYGIRQVYGENGGPGGIFHALRITPPILAICTDIMELCPDAYVFNYSNPMTAIVTTVHRKFPQLKFIGLCHEIASIRRYVPSMLGTTFENLKYRAAGLNHFSVLLSASYRDTGKDAYPDILEKAPSFFEKLPGFSELLRYALKTGIYQDTEGTVEKLKTEAEEPVRSWSDRYLFKKILEVYHLLPITTDSHIGEYISWAFDGSDHQGILDFYTFYRNGLQHHKPEIQLKMKERVVPIIEGILTNSNYEESAVNVPNTDLLPELPSFVAVEVPAIIGKDGVKGIRFDSYPKGFAALLRNYTGVYDLTAEAVLTGKRDFVVQAILANPVVSECNRIDELVDSMLNRQKQWLGYIK